MERSSLYLISLTNDINNIKCDHNKRFLFRWNVRRKWKMSMIHYDAMPDQEHVLDEAYLDALEQKVT
jgi:hypothetical protein